MRTRLTDLLGIEHPVMLAGMGGVSYSALTAAVSQAGGFGCLGASTMSSDELREEMALTRQATARPFGVDLLTAFPDALVAQTSAAIDGGASLLVAGLGVPSRVVEICHERGVLVASLCGKVDHARRALDAGCDLVVAQGTEAGGHTGSVATFPLVPLVVDAVAGQVPVVAAGGVADGRGLAAALALGADGVWVGTRFIATPEARALPGYHQRILAAHEDHTVISRAFTGKTMRVMRNATTDRYEADPASLRPFPDQLRVAVSDGTFHLGGDGSTREVDPEREGYPAGQVIGAINDVVPAAQIVTEMVTRAEAILAELARAR